jgi:two-component system LytT family response regulator
MMKKALIIEDEILASRHLRKILEETGEVMVSEVLESITETVEWFKNNRQPDIVFMDVQLADGLAFEIFKHVKINCPIVFTTAYDEYALKAFKVNSVDYLLKPVELSDVQKALEKLRILSSVEKMQNAVAELFNSYRTSSKYKTHFLIPVRGDKLVPVQASDVAYFFIDSGIVKAYTFDGRSHTFEYTLDELEKLLNPDLFFRANRQYIISRESVKDIDLWFNNRLSVNLKTGSPEKIIISKARIGDFKKWFGSGNQ